MSEVSAYEWLQDIAVGAEVTEMVDYGRRYVIRKVERVTPTQVVVGGRKFRKSNGEGIGHFSGWDRPSIHPVTDEIRAACERRGLLDALRRAPWDRYETEVLRAAVRAVGIK